MTVLMTNNEMLETVNRIISMQNREEESKTKLFGDRIRIIYAIKKNKERLIQLLKPYEDSRKELLKECNTESAEAEGRVEIKKDCKGKWSKTMGELLGIEVEVDVHRIKFSELEGLSLSMNDLEAIDFMLDEPESLGK